MLKAAFYFTLFYFKLTIGRVSQDEPVKLFKLTEDATIVGLITDDESLYIASEGRRSGEVFIPK